ncbi:MAG: hypothetical protein ACI8RZ_002709 [Myxococcota bacterium]|jgi:hypothetical protein
MTSAASRQPPLSGSSRLWALLTLGAAAVAQPIHWRAGLLALLAGLIGGLLWRRPQVSAGLLALGAAPLWVAACSAHPGAMVLAVVAVLLHRDGLPRAVPWLVLAVAGVQAARLALLSDALPLSAGLVLPLLAGGAAAAGAASASPGRLPAGALGLSGALLLGLAAVSWRQLPTTPAAVERAAEFGVLTHQPLPKGPLTSVALTAVPDWHDLAMTLPPVDALAAGWRPAGAPLESSERITVARLLERDGDGSAGLRLLRGGDALALVWWRVLFERLQGHSAPWSGGVLPDEPLIHLDGVHVLDLLLTRAGSTELLLHSDRDVSGLRLSLSGEWFEGPPELEIILDHRASIVQVGIERRGVELGPLTAGPHRLLLRFLNDLQGAEGDRNITVHSLRTE